MLVSALSANAIDFTVGGIKYSEFRPGKSVYCEGLSTTASNNSTFTTVTIPGWITYNGVSYNVEGIDATAFYQERYIQTLVVNYGVQKISYGAFMDCTSLKSVKLPSSITSVGSKAFNNNAIQNLYLCWLTMPSVASDAFDAAGMVNWKVWAPTYPAMNAIKNLTALKTQYPTFAVNATSACDATIGGLPFIVTKAATSSTLGEMALVGPNDYQGALTLSNTATASLDDYHLTGQRYYGKSIADSAFVDNTKMTSVTIPSSYTTVGEGAFRGATVLATANVAAKLVKKYAFMFCQALTTFNLNEGVEVLDTYALYNTRNLTTFYISKTVKSLGEFNYNLSYLQQLVRFTVADDNAYYSTDNDGALYNKAKTIFYRCPPKATQVYIANTVKKIETRRMLTIKGLR